MTFRAAARSGNGQSTTTNNPAIVIPATAQAGDVAVLLVDVTSNPTLTTPTGWTLKSGPDVSTTVQRGWLLVKTLVSGDPGSTVNLALSFATRAGAIMLVHSGVTETGLQFALQQDASAVHPYAVPTLTGVPAGADLVALTGRRRADAAVAITTTGYTSPTNGDFATNYGAAVANAFGDSGYIESSAGGSVGGENWTAASNTISVGSTYLVALPQASAARSAALSGSGSLTAQLAALTATQAAALSSTGSLAGTDVPGYARSAPLSSTGTLVVAGVVGFTRAAALSSTGTLAGDTAQGFVIPGALSGDGELQAGALGFAEAPLDSTGTLSAIAGSPTVVIGASLGGSGTLIAGIAPGLMCVALLSGSGTLTALGVITPRDAQLSGSGYLSTWGQNVLRIGGVVPITFRLGGALPSRIYVGDVLAWRP